MVFSDSAGNKFLGDCQYGNHNIDYPNTDFLKAHPLESISAELTALCSSSGLKYGDVLSQARFENGGVDSRIFLYFAAQSDSISKRYTFAKCSLSQSYYAWGAPVIMYSEPGYALSDNLVFNNGTPNLISQSANVSNVTNTFKLNSMNHIYPLTATVSNIFWVGVSDGESLGLFTYQYNFSNNQICYSFFYAGILEAVNTNFNYYSANHKTKSVLLCNYVPGFTAVNNVKPIRGAHYIANASKYLLQTGAAAYPIVCADGQSPSSQWATDFYVFDDNPSLGYPAMGRVRNLLLATGDFTIGKPVKIQGGTLPDNGFNRWLPIGTFAGKTVLMRCYSTVNI